MTIELSHLPIRLLQFPAYVNRASSFRKEIFGKRHGCDDEYVTVVLIGGLAKLISMLGNRHERFAVEQQLVITWDQVSEDPSGSHALDRMRLYQIPKRIA